MCAYRQCLFTCEIVGFQSRSEDSCLLIYDYRCQFESV